MKITSKTLIPLAVLVMAFTMTSKVWAHGGGGHGMDMGEGGKGHEGGKEEGPPTPYEDPLDFWPFTRHSNETPEDVEKRRASLLAQLEESRGRGASPQVLRNLDIEVRKLDLDLEIARKRRDRDTMRKDGRREQAEILETEIHQLKFRREGLHETSPGNAR